MTFLEALRSIGKEVCRAAANQLQAAGVKEKEISLHLRSAGLGVADARILGEALRGLPQQGGQRLRSFSVSYNPLLGDRGAAILAGSLPLDVSEIGFVGCGMGDAGGRALLEWASQSTRLRMLCAEGNALSDGIKEEFSRLQKGRPGLVMVV